MSVLESILLEESTANLDPATLEELAEALTKSFEEVVTELRLGHEADASRTASDGLAKKAILVLVARTLDSLNSKELE
jgi:ABC-type polar amino acid transport system ATPase subunit